MITTSSKSHKFVIILKTTIENLEDGILLGDSGHALKRDLMTHSQPTRGHSIELTGKHGSLLSKPLENGKGDSICYILK